MHIIFWQNIISPHQAAFMQGLAQRGHDVVVVAAESMSVSRSQLGWSPPDVAPARVLLSPSAADVQQLIQDSHPETIHCVAGARVIPLGQAVVRLCKKYERRVGLITETPDPRGLAGYARWLKYMIEARCAGKRFGFVLAMGEMGARWCHSVGYPASRVFPFCYVSVPEALEEQVGIQRVCSDNSVNAIFVGRLVHLKGVDVLLRAAAAVPNVKLCVVGDGPQLLDLQRLAKQLGITSRICWRGRLDPPAVAAEIAAADVLVLPSRKDGWGAVVNEALSLGTPVICSSAAGACDLLRHEWLGMVVPPNDEAALRDALVRWAQGGSRPSEDRSRIREWATCITGTAVAEYIENVFHHIYEGGERPTAPWRV